MTAATVAAGPNNHPKRAGWRSNLGNALQIRFERTGTLADLDEAIEYVNSLSADGDFEKRTIEWAWRMATA